MFALCATVGLVFFAAFFMLLLLSEFSPGEALGLALFGGVLAGLAGATFLVPIMTFPFQHPIGGGMVYGIVMAAIAGWRRDAAPLGMLAVGVPSGFAVFILLCTSSGVLHH